MTVIMEREQRALWRLELACGHTAFGLEDEPHREGLVRVCHACNALVRIRQSVPFRAAAKPKQR